MNIFEEAVRSKFEFKTTRGAVSVEDLFDMNLTGLKELNTSLRNEIRQLEKDFEEYLEDDLDEVKTQSKESKELDVLKKKKEIIVTIYKEKKEEQNKAKLKAENDSKLATLKQLLAQKTYEEQKNMSKEELATMIKELEK